MEFRRVLFRSEPEAALARDKFKTFRPLYNVQLTSDVDTPLILDYGVYASNTDAGLFIPTLQRLPPQLGHMPAKVLVDGIYATAANLAYSEQHGVTLYAPVDDRAAGDRTKSGTAKAKYLGKEQFRWHAAEKTYPKLLSYKKKCAIFQLFSVASPCA